MCTCVCVCVCVLGDTEDAKMITWLKATVPLPLAAWLSCYEAGREIRDRLSGDSRKKMGKEHDT